MKHLYLVILTYLFASCSTGNETNAKSNSTSKMEKGISYLALGDSYTIGESVPENENWPNQLAQSLEANGSNIIKTTIIAKTGWTTAKLLLAIAKTKPEKHDLVSLSIGVNNQYQHLLFDQFTKEFDELILVAQSLCKQENSVFIVSIPDYGSTPFGTDNKVQIGKEIDSYNIYAKEKCKALGIPYIDITSISRKLEDNKAAVAYDNLHPSGYQYTEWVKEISPIVRQLLK